MSARWLMVALAMGCSPRGGTPPLETVATGNVSNPTVALSEHGTAYVTWVATDSSGSNVWFSRREPAGGFSTPRRVNDKLNDAQPHLQAPARVAAGPGGAVYVVWSNATPIPGRRFPASNLRFARSNDGGTTFSPAIHVNDDAEGPPAGHTFQDMIVAEDGTIYVSWIDSRSRVPHHAMGDSGSHSGSEVRVAHSGDGGRSFSAGTVVASSVCPCCRTALAARRRDLWVAWRSVLPGDVRDVVVAHSADGGRTFAEAVRVHADDWVYPGCPHAGPALALSSSGELHVSWYTGVESHPGLFQTVSTDGGRGFRPPRAMQRQTTVPVSFTAMAAGGAAMWRAWEDRTGADPTIVVRRGTGRPVSLGPGAAPSIAAGPAGATVVWMRSGAVCLASLR